MPCRCQWVKEHVFLHEIPLSNVLSSCAHDKPITRGHCDATGCKNLWYLWSRLDSDALIWRYTWAQCICCTSCSCFIMIFELAYDPIWLSTFLEKGIDLYSSEPILFRTLFWQNQLTKFSLIVPSLSNLCSMLISLHLCSRINRAFCWKREKSRCF